MYAVRLSPGAERLLRKLSPEVNSLLRAAIPELAQNPRDHSCLPLVGESGWRKRVGRYRIKYLIDDKASLVWVYWVGHRKNAYD